MPTPAPVLRSSGCGCWDYQGKAISKIGFVAPDLDPATARKVGHPVRLTITAERFTDPAWRVEVGHLR